jgi:uncharacterized protein (DUF885 family)
MRKVTFLLLLLLAGCARLPQGSSSSRVEAEVAFAVLANEFIAGYLAWRPQTGTALGFHEYDGQATDYRRASLDAELARLKRYEAQLRQFPAGRLGRDTALDYRILCGAIRREIFGFEEMRAFAQNPMTYAGAYDVSIYVKRDFAPLEARARSVVAILNQVPSGLAAARANLDESLPRPHVETAMQMADGAADFLGRDLAAALAELKDEKLREDFAAANSRAIAELRAYATWLKEQKLPRANDQFALGREKYARLMLYGEGIALPPEQLLEIGRRELQREQRIFAETAARIDPGRKPIDVFQAIQKEHPTAENLLADTRKNLEAIRQFLPDHQIVTLPGDTRVRMAETPQFLRATSFASMDTPGPFETRATEAYYYVTPVELDWPAARKEEWLTAFNFYTTDVVSIHEAYPGHYIQFLCLKASPASRIRKMFASYAFVEGWAHYTEQMMLEQGFGAGPAGDAAGALTAAKYRLAQSDEALLRLCRLCVSIRMHCQGLSVDEATRFFRENCYYEAKPARQEAVRGAFDPEYLYYSLGKLAFLKLREDYRQQEGTTFSLRKFHDEALRHGAPPPGMLREIMLKKPARRGGLLGDPLGQ